MKKNILAIDFGGTTCKVAIINNNREIVKRIDEIPTKSGNDLSWLFDAVHKQIKPSEYDAVGFAVPGFIDHQNGVIKTAPNTGMENFDVKKQVSELTNKQAFVINDANAAALGEYWFNDDGTDSLLFYTIGTGVGGGLVINNKLVFGAHGFAGEFGHGLNVGSNYKCGCGLTGCVETMASASGLCREVNKYLANNPTSPLCKLVKHNPVQGVIDFAHLITDGNKELLKVIEPCISALTTHISTLLYALDIPIIFIGGGVSRIGKPFTDLIYNSLMTKVNKNLFGETQIKVAKLENDAGIFGAAKWVLDNI